VAINIKHRVGRKTADRALDSSIPCVAPYVMFQIERKSRFIIALGTFVPEEVFPLFTIDT